MANFWIADASGIQLLDLSVPEFRVKENTTLISALDLCGEPRFISRTGCLTFVGPQTIRRHYVFVDHSSPSFRTGIRMIPNVRLIEVFREAERIPSGIFPNIEYNGVIFRNDSDFSEPEFEARVKAAWLASVFCDFSIYTFEKLATKWEVETMKRYWKQLKLHIRCIENSLFFFYLAEPVFRTFGKAMTHWIRIRSNIRKWVMRIAASKLMKFMFDNAYEDSRFVTEVFFTVCHSWELQADLFFGYECELTEYILRNLKKEKCDMNDIWEFFKKPIGLQFVILNSPKHLMMHLNYGIKSGYLCTLLLRELAHRDWWLHEPVHWLNRTREHHSILCCTKREPREAAVLQLSFFYSGWSRLDFTTYLESQRIIWRAIPDPYLTYEEMKDVLAKYIDSRFAEERCAELQKYEFDCFDRVVQPRSLMHFSRCVIRDALNSNSKMPEGIELLGLSARMQSFIRLEF